MNVMRGDLEIVIVRLARMEQSCTDEAFIHTQMKGELEVLESLDSTSQVSKVSLVRIRSIDEEFS